MPRGRPALLAGGDHEGLDGGLDALGAGADLLQGGPVLGRLALAAQRQVDLGRDLGEGGAQLVRHLGGQAPLAPDAGREPVQQAVERRREAGDLVVRRADVEAVVEVALAPGGGVVGHARDRAAGRRAA